MQSLAPDQWETVDKKKLSNKEKGEWLRRMGRELAQIYRSFGAVAFDFNRRSFGEEVATSESSSDIW